RGGLLFVRKRELLSQLSRPYTYSCLHATTWRSLCPAQISPPAAQSPCFRAFRPRVTHQRRAFRGGRSGALLGGSFWLRSGGEMSEEGDGLPVVRVKFACANVEEFRRKFEANLLAKGMLARTPQMHEVGKRLTLRLELQDGSLGVDEEAVVQALEWTGGKQAMRLQLLRAKNPTAPAPAVASPAAAPAPASNQPQAVALPPPARVATG